MGGDGGRLLNDDSEREGGRNRGDQGKTSPFAPRCLMSDVLRKICHERLLFVLAFEDPRTKTSFSRSKNKYPLLLINSLL